MNDMKTKKIIYYSIFFLIFLFQSGIFYLIYFKSDLFFIIQSFLISGLILCFSGGFILLYLGVKREDKNVRLFGFMLIFISFLGIMFTL